MMSAIISRLRLFAGVTLCAWLSLFGRDRDIAEMFDFLSRLSAPFHGDSDRLPRRHGDQR